VRRCPPREATPLAPPPSEDADWRAGEAGVARLPAFGAVRNEHHEIRGLEGAGSGTYFRQFGKMLSTVGFPGRKRRPATDPANSLLSLGYVMVGNELSSLLEARGFDPAIGFLHGVRYGRSSLALDVVEVFRQPVVDRLTLRLLNLGQIKPDDFEGGQKGLRMRPEALKRYFERYEEQLRTPSEGAESPSWRERLKHQVEAVREMVMAGEPAPFYQWPG
jgi:CRISP-associated protein Cas1